MREAEPLGVDVDVFAQLHALLHQVLDHWMGNGEARPAKGPA